MAPMWHRCARFLLLGLPGCGLWLPAYKGEDGDRFGVDVTRETGESQGSGDTADTSDSSDSGQESADSTDSEEEVDLSLSSVEPSSGTSAGGLELTLRGAGLATVARVSIGGIGTDILEQSDSELVVATPIFDEVEAEQGKADVDVIVSSEDGQIAVLEDAFRFYLDGEGEAGAVGSVEFYHHLGDYWGDGSDLAFAELSFTSPPVDLSYWNFASASMENCEDDTYDLSSAFGDIYVLDLETPEVALQVGTARYELAFDAEFSTYRNDAIDPEDLPDAELVLDVSAGGYYAEDFSLSPVAALPASFEIRAPSMDTSAPPLLDQSSLNVRWDADTTHGDQVLVFAYLIDGVSEAPLDSVFCVAEDDGLFTVPEAAWSDAWSSGDYVILYIGRVVETVATLPYNNAESRISGIYWNIGAGVAP